MREGNQNQDFKTTHRLNDYFIQNKISVDYKNSDLLKKFLSPEGKILPARRTGLIAVNQRKITKAIKKARILGLIPYVNEEN